MRIEVSDVPSESERLAILDGLAAFNAASGYPGDMKPIAVLLKDDEGEIVGGMWGKTVYDWMFVEYLVVPEALRGQDLGSRLMRRGRGDRHRARLRRIVADHLFLPGAKFLRRARLSGIRGAAAVAARECPIVHAQGSHRRWHRRSGLNVPA